MWRSARGVIEVGRVGAVAGQLPRERPVLDAQLVGDHLVALAVVAGDATGDRQLGLEPSRGAHGDPLADADARAVDLDGALADTDQVAGLADPGQLVQAVEEEPFERGPLLSVGVLVDVEDDGPRRSGLVVVVPADECDVEPADLDAVDGAALDRPREDAVALAVRRAAAEDAADLPARADRLAVARLEVRAAEAVAQVAHRNARFSTKIAAPASAIHQ